MARRRPSTDVLIALGAGVEMQAELLFVDAPRRDVLIARCAFLFMAGAAVLALLGIGMSTTVTDPSELVATFFPLLILAYGGGAYAQGRAGGLVLAILLVAVCVVALADAGATASDVYFPGLIVTLCWLGGRTVRLRLHRAAELHETAALAAEQREREAQQAVADERRRIAREMHDVVTHSISIMVVQAGGARRILAGDPARAEQAAAQIRRAGIDALAEMDVLLVVLEPGHVTVAALDGVEELVARTRGAGLPVTLAISGDRRPLPLGDGHAQLGRGSARGADRRPRRRRRQPAAGRRGARADRHARAHPGGRRRAGDRSATRRRLRSRRPRTGRWWHAPGLTLTRREGL